MVFNSILHGSEFFKSTDSDFTDLVHFNDDAQRRFTLGLSGYLSSHRANPVESN